MAGLIGIINMIETITTVKYKEQVKQLFLAAYPEHTNKDIRITCNGDVLIYGEGLHPIRFVEFYTPIKDWVFN